jgi:predicted nucleic acid-binding protein
VSRFVVDASVALKWYLPEVHRLHAQRLRDPRHDLVAPELFPLEVANTLLKKVRRGEFPDDRVIPAMRSVGHIVDVLSTRDRVRRVVELATRFGRTV